MAEAIVSAFRRFGDHPIEELRLIPSSGGRFEVTADDELIYSKAATGAHTTNEYVVEELRRRLLAARRPEE